MKALWIEERDVLAIHDRLLALHGGAPARVLPMLDEVAKSGVGQSSSRANSAMMRMSFCHTPTFMPAFE